MRSSKEYNGTQTMGNKCYYRTSDWNGCGEMIAPPTPAQAVPPLAQYMRPFKIPIVERTFSCPPQYKPLNKMCGSCEPTDETMKRYEVGQFKNGFNDVCGNN